MCVMKWQGQNLPMSNKLARTEYTFVGKTVQMDKMHFCNKLWAVYMPVFGKIEKSIYMLLCN